MRLVLCLVTSPSRFHSIYPLFGWYFDQICIGLECQKSSRGSPMWSRRWLRGKVRCDCMIPCAGSPVLHHGTARDAWNSYGTRRDRTRSCSHGAEQSCFVRYGVGMGPGYDIKGQERSCLDPVPVPVTNPCPASYPVLFCTPRDVSCVPLLVGTPTTCMCWTVGASCVSGTPREVFWSRRTDSYEAVTRHQRVDLPLDSVDTVTVRNVEGKESRHAPVI